MPTAYIKKLAKLNHTTVNKIEKFWSQAKEIAKSEGNGKAWGLITTIFQNKLKKEGYKVKAFKEETLKVDDKKFIFKRLSLSDCVKQIEDLFDDYFNFGKKDPEYYEKLHNTKVDESTASDLLSDDTTVYIEYNDGSKWYSINNPKLKDLKLTGIKNCIIEYPAYTAYFGRDCRIERFDDAEDAPYVVKCEAKMKQYAYNGKVITASSREEAIKVFAGFKTSKQIWQVAGELSDGYKEYKNTLENIVKMLSSYKSKKLIDVRQLKDSEITDSGMSFSFIVETKRNKKVKKFIWNIKNKEYGCEMNLYYGNEKDRIENMDSVGSKKTLDTIKNFIFGLG